ncbi:MAG: hypothetical protein WC562_06555 [Dehalococcoidia bacterium]
MRDSYDCVSEEAFYDKLATEGLIGSPSGKRALQELKMVDTMKESYRNLKEKYQARKAYPPDFRGTDYKKGGLVIVGQDGGITTKSIVRKVLMLDDEDSSLYKYVSQHILSPLNLTVDQIIALNLVNLSFNTSLARIAKWESIPFDDLVNGLAELSYDDFKEKLSKYKPKYVITLGQPVFQFLQRKAGVTFHPIREVFATGIEIVLDNDPLICLPCVHMRTYNVNRKVYKDQDNRLRKWALNQRL